MPVRAKKPCGKVGCDVLVDIGYCDKHKSLENQGRIEYDKNRPNSNERGYDSAWRRARIGWLKKHPLCVDCEREGVIKGATEVDHIIDHKGDKFLFWDSENNWQSLCKMHHSRKTALSNGWGR